MADRTMTIRRAIVWAGLFVATTLMTAPRDAAGVLIPVSDDASVVSTNPADNYGTATFRGGLFTGTANGSEARFYLKFYLPAFVPGTQILSAVMTGTYNDDLFEAIDAEHGIFLVTDDSWSESTLTWNSQPGFSGTPIAIWDASAEPGYPASRSFDITAAVNQQYALDGTISLAFAPLDPSQNLTWEYWSSKEHTTQPGFILDLRISDATPPSECEAAQASPSQIWPVNQKMVAVGVTGVTDRDGNPLTIRIDAISQDEPPRLPGIGSGNTCPDGDGIGTGTARVRAERAGSSRIPGDGRVYHVHFTASDRAGARCSGEVLVCVPHDQRPGRSCTDQGALYDSTTCD